MVFVAALRHALCAALLAALFVFALCLPWVDLGLWRQTETATVGLHATAAVAGILLVLMALAGDMRSRAALKHPLPLTFAAIGLLSVLLAPFHPDPARTLHGLLEHGIGGLWYFDVALLAAGYIATGFGPMRAVYAWTAAATAAGAIILTALFLGHGENPWVPYGFAGWIGFLAPLAAAPLFAIGRRNVTIAGAILLAVGLVVGHNSTAFMACGLVVGCVISHFWLPVDRRPSPERLRKFALWTSTVVLLGIAIGLPLVASPLERIATAGVSTSGDAIPSLDPRDHVAIDKKPYGTVWSRSWMIKTVVDNLLEHPSSLLIGRGWGDFPQVYVEQWRDVPGRAFEHATDTGSLTYWDPHRKAEFHTHNLVVEAMLSLGIAGAALMIMALLAPLAFAKRENVAAAAFLTFTISVVGGMWFMVNTMAPFLALAGASVVTARVDDEIPTPAPLLSILATLAISGTLMFFSGILFGVSKTEYAARYFAPMTWTDKPPCRAVAGYMSPDREVNSALYRKFVSSGEAQPAPFVWFATRMKTAINYACILRTISDRHADADVISTSLDMRNQLLRASGNFPPIEKGLAVEIRYWEDDIHRLWQAAPARTEVVIPYVSWLISKGDKEKALEAIGRLDPSVKSDDPVSFWLHARRAELTGDTAGYKTLMTDALHRGLANLLPLSKAETSYFLGAQDKR